MLTAETRPRSAGGVTACRSVVVAMTQRIGPAPNRNRLRAASAALGQIAVAARTSEAAKPVTGPSATTVPKRRRRSKKGAASAPTTVPPP